VGGASLCNSRKSEEELSLRYGNPYGRVRTLVEKPGKVLEFYKWLFLGLEKIKSQKF